jgi:hypothetical protein
MQDGRSNAVIDIAGGLPGTAPVSERRRRSHRLGALLSRSRDGDRDWHFSFCRIKGLT